MELSDQDRIHLKALFESAVWQKTVPFPGSALNRTILLTPDQWAEYKKSNENAPESARTEYAWYIYDPDQDIEVSLNDQRPILAALKVACIPAKIVQNNAFLGGDDAGFVLVDGPYRDHLNKLRKMYAQHIKGSVCP